MYERDIKEEYTRSESYKLLRDTWNWNNKEKTHKKDIGATHIFYQTCRGNYSCENKNCPFFIFSEGVPNQYTFTDGICDVCIHTFTRFANCLQECGEKGKHSACAAIKVGATWEDQGKVSKMRCVVRPNASTNCSLQSISCWHS